MLNKILKIVGIILLLLVISAFVIPYFFKDQIKAKILSSINENVDAKVAYADADLSLFRNFPNASVSIENLSIINKAPFEGDTLVAFEELNLKMSIKELFKGNEEPINIDGISSKNGLINIIFNKDGIGNYDIALKNKSKKEDKKSNFESDGDEYIFLYEAVFASEFSELITKEEKPPTVDFLREIYKDILKNETLDKVNQYPFSKLPPEGSRRSVNSRNSTNRAIENAPEEKDPPPWLPTWYLFPNSLENPVCQSHDPRFVRHFHEYLLKKTPML